MLSAKKPSRRKVSVVVSLLGLSSGAFACTSAANDAGDGGAGGGPASGGAADDAGSGSVGSGGAGSGGAGAGGSGGASGGTSSGGSGAGGSGDPVDVFGIAKLYASAPSGAEWSSQHWNDGRPYAITASIDANDPLGISGFNGTGTLQVTGTGELVMGGSEPRLYVFEGEDGPWRDLEVTVYYQRVEDDGTAYSGLVVGVRSGPDGHNTDTPCDAHTYYARLRHDGATDFEKELKHPASSTQSSIDAEEVWPPAGELPHAEWIGWKFVIYNLGSASVKLEAYRDLTLGQDGGDWQLLNETVDEGGWFAETDCAEHQPSGGQSDLVVVDGGVVLVRNSNITEARYRWLSIREIAP